MESRSRLLLAFVLVLSLLGACTPAAAPTEVASTAAPVAVSTKVASTAVPAVASAGAAATAVATPVVSGTTSATKSVGGTLRIVGHVDVTSLDPHATGAWTSYMVQELMYDNLVDWDDNGQVIPGLAKSWTISDDSKTYTFKLREGLKFSDGTVLDANAVKASFDRLLDPARSTGASGQVTFIESVQAADAQTVVLKTKNVYPLTLQMLGTGVAAIVSPADIKTYGAKAIEKPVGSGPYVFVEWLQGDHVTVKRNPNYWGEPAGFDEIIVRSAPEASVRLTAVVNGEADLASAMAPNDLPTIKSNADLKVIPGGGAKLVYFNLSNVKAPTDDVRVRLAMNYAVNRKPLLEDLLYNSGNKEIDSPVASQDFGYYSVGAYPYNPDKARELLKEANYDTSQTLEAIYPTGSYYFAKEIAEAVQADLAAVGIKVNLTAYPSSAQYNSLEKEMNKINMAYTSFYPSVMDADGALYLRYRTGLALNYNYSNARVDELIDSARSTLDEATRKTMYKEIQEKIMADAPFLTLYTQAANAVSVKGLEGVKLYPNERLSVKSAYFTK